MGEGGILLHQRQEDNTKNYKIELIFFLKVNSVQIADILI